jgi:hypothetical protein
VSQKGEAADVRKQNYPESIGWYDGITADMFAKGRAGRCARGEEGGVSEACRLQPARPVIPGLVPGTQVAECSLLRCFVSQSSLGGSGSLDPGDERRDDTLLLRLRRRLRQRAIVGGQRRELLVIE